MQFLPLGVCPSEVIAKPRLANSWDDMVWSENTMAPGRKENSCAKTVSTTTRLRSFLVAARITEGKNVVCLRFWRKVCLQLLHIYYHLYLPCPAFHVCFTLSLRSNSKRSRKDFPELPSSTISISVCVLPTNSLSWFKVKVQKFEILLFSLICQKARLLSSPPFTFASKIHFYFVHVCHWFYHANIGSCL